MNAPAPVELRGVSKYFAGTPVLKKVDLALHAGQVHGLVGANGSGKSTLIKVLAGVYHHDEGEVLNSGEEVARVSPEWATHHGLRFIHQNPSLFDELTVIDNISVGARFSHSKAFVNSRAERRAAVEALELIGADIRPDELVRDLSPAQRTMVAVARAIQVVPGAEATRVLVLDEPTAALNESESQRLFDVIDRVTRMGIAVLYVSHRLQEVVDLCHEVTVLRDGERIAHLTGEEITEDALVRLIVSRDVAVAEYRERVEHDHLPPLKVQSISSAQWEDVSFEVHPGEIVGIAGLLGSGRSELLQSISGLHRISGGSVFLGDSRLPSGDPIGSARRGVTYISENRIQHGAFPGLTVRENMTTGVRARAARVGGLLNPRRDRAEADRLIEEYDIRPRRTEQEFWSLSGGNQQKAVLARAIREKPAVILLDEPTQAVDVGAKAEIHQTIANLAADGSIVLVVSSDFAELIQLSHRILVLRHGRLIADRPTSGLQEEDVVKLAAVATDDVASS